MRKAAKQAKAEGKYGKAATLSTTASAMRKVRALTTATGTLTKAVGLTGAGIVYEHMRTDGESTRTLTRFINRRADDLADAVGNIAPEIANAIRNFDAKDEEKILALIAAPFDTVRVALDETLILHGVDTKQISAQAMDAATYALQGNLIHGAIAATGHDIKEEDLRNILENARIADNPQDYIAAEIGRTTGMSKEAVQDALKPEETAQNIGQALVNLGKTAKDKAENKWDQWADMWNNPQHMSAFFTNAVGMPGWAAGMLTGLVTVIKEIVDGFKSLFSSFTKVQTKDHERRYSPMARELGMYPQDRAPAPAGPAATM